MKPKESHLSQHEELIQDCVRSDAMSEILTAENSSEDGNGGEDFIDSNEDLVFKKYIQDEDKPTKEGEGVSKSKGIIEVFSDYLESIFSTEEEHDEEIEEELTAMYWLLWKILNYTLGVIAVVVILTKYPQYLDILHENQLWFSNIKEIEREISFRTEQGLYYSYFKEIIKAPSWIEGCNQLMKDNSTEHGRTINIIHRFNILPEIVLSAAFRWLSSQESPSVFYVSSVFGLHGVFISALYVTAWYLSGSVLAGMITVILFVIHRIDTTRVNYTVPLRESFAIPFLFFQIFVMCTFIKSGRCQIVKLAVIFIMSVVFLQSWQFAAFILLCQLFCLVSLGRLLLLSAAKVNKLVLVLGASLLVSCTIQANPPLVISSPALSMVVPALILSATHTPDRTMGSVIRMIITTAELSLLLFVTVLINGSIKIFLNIDADSHVYQLLFAKLQMGDPRNFDSRLYMCTEAFDYIDIKTLERLCDSGLLPVYSIAVFVYLVSCAKSFIMKIPEECLECHAEDSPVCKGDLQKVSSTDEEDSHSSHFKNGEKQRKTENSKCEMKNLFENMCETELEKNFSEKVMKNKAQSDYVYCSCRCSQGQCIIEERPELVFFLGEYWISAWLTWYWGKILSELWPEEVYEFWDPDTVELMEWIQSSTPPEAVFAGSMQLLAGVKLCTGRHITNHPHYEDSWLRQRTHQIYQIYGKETPEVVYAALKSAGATHIILEDSICFIPPDEQHPLCRLTDIIDLHNGHMPEYGGQDIPGLIEPLYGRFCDKIRYKIAEYNRFFSLVLSNKTFRVYRVAVT
nr:probable C-mannosyltransferase DPY19L3 isoform X4 [Cherax quadricarinatus]